jgi:hypothetical protein
MKTKLTLQLAFVLAGCCASAQFAIDWFTIDGGGGTSSNNTYVVSGTIGQPDAGSLTGGAYSVEGGFWPAIRAVQIPGGPFLSIVHSGANVIVSWTPATPGFVLQQTPVLAPISWQNAPSGITNPAMIPANTAARFYRLIKP